MANDAYPDVRQWTFPVRPRNGVEPRTYEQRELSIDGEMQLFALVARTSERLREADFDFSRVGAVFGWGDDPDSASVENVDWKAVPALLAAAAQVAPAVLSEAAALMLGIFPMDQNGSRNKDWGDEVAFLRSSLHTADVVEMLETAAAQNDVERLLSPFARAREMLSRYSLPQGR